MEGKGRVGSEGRIRGGEGRGEEDGKGKDREM